MLNKSVLSYFYMKFVLSLPEKLAHPGLNLVYQMHTKLKFTKFHSLQIREDMTPINLHKKGTTEIEGKTQVS